MKMTLSIYGNTFSGTKFVWKRKRKRETICSKSLYKFTFSLVSLHSFALYEFTFVAGAFLTTTFISLFLSLDISFPLSLSLSLPLWNFNPKRRINLGVSRVTRINPNSFSLSLSSATSFILFEPHRTPFYARFRIQMRYIFFIHVISLELNLNLKNIFFKPESFVVLNLYLDTFSLIYMWWDFFSLILFQW